MKNNTGLPIILIGGGGHARVLADILLQQDKQIAAVVSPEPLMESPLFDGINHLSSDEDVRRYAPDEVLLVNAIGMLPGADSRKKVCEYFLAQGYTFESVIAPTATVSAYATIKQGAQIMSGAIIQAGAVIGEQTIVNTQAVIEHDCQIGSRNHIAPGSTVCGEVTTGNDVFVGAGATIINGMTIGSNAIIGAGTCITRAVDDGKTVRR
ncbi:acetyltransferase [Salinimonas iocasae]|uniref:Acetyltransferase n=1 Tax=Salinimonas iocasae TaxID=2572577 RepID=A0A5B7YFX3_9ALTE|nr:acetyltransferase [Salinimonas iocasae]QCZ94270.1 acetyltransferase [Salinimonas iocasae]